METFRKADVLFCMFFLHRMFIKENILLTDSEDKKLNPVNYIISHLVYISKQNKISSPLQKLYMRRRQNIRLFKNIRGGGKIVLPLQKYMKRRQNIVASSKNI